MTAALRSLYRRLVRRAYLAAGRRACRVRIKVSGSARRGARLDVVGAACWWATRDDVAAELARAWRSARRQFARRHGYALVLDAPVVFKLEGTQWRGGAQP